MNTILFRRSLVRYVLPILLCMIAGALGGFLVYQNTTPMYRATAAANVSGVSDSVTSDEPARRLLAGQRAAALSSIAGTPAAVNSALRAAGHPRSAPLVTADAPDGGSVLTITVVDSDPAVAQQVATAYFVSLPETAALLDGPTAVPVSLTVISPAVLPTTPITASMLWDLGVGTAAGLVLGITIVLLREALTRRVRDSREVEKLTGLVVMGTVPRKSPKKLLPVMTDPRGARAEGYRQIRTSLINSSTHRPLVIAVTSAAPGEGKTSVVTNLAAALSRAGHLVALVDADLRRPRVAEHFEVQATFGLTDVLSGRRLLEDAMVVLDGGRLAILPAGRIPQNPSEALGGVAMDEILTQLAEYYDFVLIDTPPVLPVTDALVLAPKVDGVILVVRLGHTTRDRVRQAMSAVARVNGTIIGVVANQAGKGSDSDYGYRYVYKSPLRRGEALTPLDIPVEELQEPQKQAHAATPLARAGRNNASSDSQVSAGTHRRSTPNRLVESPATAKHAAN